MDIHTVRVEGREGVYDAIDQRRCWEVMGENAEGRLIQAFASEGFDVVRVYQDQFGAWTTDPNAPRAKELPGLREVKLNGATLAIIHWHRDVPDFAFASTPKV